MFLGRRPLNLDQAFWALSFKSTLAAKKTAKKTRRRLEDPASAYRHISDMLMLNGSKRTPE